MAVDDRSPRERKAGLQKSRYSSINYFISNDKRNFKRYSDNKFTINKRFRKYLLKRSKEEGLKIDNALANHLAYLHVRDNICVFKDKLHDIPECTFHFEAFQSSNWNDVRLKPPPSLDSTIGWRVEFRSPECQISPEQNFLISHGVQLIQRLIVNKSLSLNFYIPISLVRIIANSLDR